MSFNIMEAIVAIGVVLSGFVGFVGMLVYIGIKRETEGIRDRLTRLEMKVETIWTFQARRAVAEVVTSDTGTLNSPLIIKDEVKARLDPIKDRLIEWFAKEGHDLPDFDSLLEIERLFGKELFELVCIPCKVSHGACLWIALSVAKQATAIEVDLHLPIHVMGKAVPLAVAAVAACVMPLTK